MPAPHVPMAADPGASPRLRIAALLDWTDPPAAQVDLGVALEAAGADLVWVAEAYGFDAPTLLGALAARTRTVLLGAGVLPVHTRSPALIAQTAASLDALSGGRAVLGLGTSGPGVVEGFHGVPYDLPLTRVRETIAVCRRVWRREPLVHRGAAYRIPLPALPPHRPLRMATRPLRPEVPVYVAALRPRSVALAAEVADGWFPLLFPRSRARALWGDPLAEGAARRDAGLGPLDVCAAAWCAVAPASDVPALRDRAREEIALYVGGMGPRRGNHYAHVAAAAGWARETAAVQDLFLAGDRAGAAAALPDALVDDLVLCGPPDRVRAGLAAYRAAGVTTVCVRPLGDPVTTVAALRELASAT